MRPEMYALVNESAIEESLWQITIKQESPFDRRESVDQLVRIGRCPLQVCSRQIVVDASVGLPGRSFLEEIDGRFDLPDCKSCQCGSAE